MVWIAKALLRSIVLAAAAVALSRMTWWTTAASVRDLVIIWLLFLFIALSMTPFPPQKYDGIDR